MLARLRMKLARTKRDSTVLQSEVEAQESAHLSKRQQQERITRDLLATVDEMVASTPP